MNMRKVGGMYFWNVGIFGGSFYVRRGNKGRLYYGMNGLLALLIVADTYIWGSLLLELF